ncbi:hypothetical protein Sphch_3251 [Sphingobium chlorophenolicum L-1]|uniref:Uncharacterized protein n=1 Tax=Sphingobium chlorophenolicum L-1 TaxID=690566 RepID=F6F349_SPHCR|nr:hypothetical protein Sphch_3251 [Sphingobium chlorophenolicum L-1]
MTQASLMIAAQGSYACGGAVRETDGTFDPHIFLGTAGNTVHGDHAYVRYQRPVDPRKLPIVLWHGGGQFMRTWETTPDDREGFDTILVRRGWEVHLVDQPGRGGAGHRISSEPIDAAAPIDRSLWQIFRLGIYPNFFDNVQFSRAADTLDQFWRQRVSDTGPERPEEIVASVSSAFARTGPAILITHSASGRLGWLSASQNASVRAVVSYEPAGFVFPHGYRLRPIAGYVEGSVPVAAATFIAEDAFARLTRIPIQIVIGDNIPEVPSSYPGLDLWRIAKARAHEFCDQINAHGGDASILCLPDIGMRGNTHFPMSDLNNLEVADQLSIFLAARGLDGRDRDGSE